MENSSEPRSRLFEDFIGICSFFIGLFSLALIPQIFVPQLLNFVVGQAYMALVILLAVDLSASMMEEQGTTRIYGLLLLLSGHAFGQLALNPSNFKDPLIAILLLAYLALAFVQHLRVELSDFRKEAASKHNMVGKLTPWRYFRFGVTWLIKYATLLICLLAISAEGGKISIWWAATLLVMAVGLFSRFILRETKTIKQGLSVLFACSGLISFILIALGEGSQDTLNPFGDPLVFIGCLAMGVGHAIVYLGFIFGMESLDKKEVEQAPS